MADERRKGAAPGGKPHSGKPRSGKPHSGEPRSGESRSGKLRSGRPPSPQKKKAPPSARAGVPGTGAPAAGSAPPKRRPPPPRKGGSADRRAAKAARQQRITETHAARRRHYKKNYTLYYIMLAAFLTITGVTLSLTVFFNIQEITVTGSSLYSEQQVLDILDARVGDNLLRLNTKRVQQNARQRLTSVESVTLRRRFPNTLEVQIEDAVVTSQVVSGGKVYQISSGGRIVGILPESEAGVVTVFGPDLSRMEAGEELSGLIKKFAAADDADEEAKKAAKAVQDEQQMLLDSAVILQKEIAACGQADISAIDVRESLALRICYQNRYEVMLGTLSELPEKLAMFQSVLKEGGLGLEEKGVLNISDPDCCIVSHSEPLLPEGLALAGWEWTDPHLENFDVFFGFAEPEPEPPADTGDGSDGPGNNDSSSGDDSSGDNSSGDNSSVDNSSASDTSEPSSDASSDEPSDSSEPSSEPASSGGFRLPQLPQIGGSSTPSASHEPSSDPVSSAPADDSGSSAPPPDSSAASSDSSSSQPGYILPQLPSTAGR